MVTSVVVGAIAVVAGLLASFHLGTAGGASIATISVLEFFAVFAAREAFEAFRRQPVAVSASS